MAVGYSCSNKEWLVFVDPPADAPIGTKVVCPGYDQGDPATENQVGKKKILDKSTGEGATSRDTTGTATANGSIHEIASQTRSLIESLHRPEFHDEEISKSKRSLVQKLRERADEAQTSAKRCSGSISDTILVKKINQTNVSF